MSARILVADGSPTARITLKVRLAAACHDVAMAGSATEILAELASGRIGLVILNGPLTDMSAEDACRLLKTRAPTSGVNIVMMVGDTQRLAARRAGAIATLDPSVEDGVLLAQIRSLLADTQADAHAAYGMAEAPQPFARAPLRKVTLIAGSPVVAMAWRSHLSRRMDCRFDVSTPEEALLGTGTGGADLYVIDTNLGHPNEGLRLMSELRARAHSCDAAYAIVTDHQSRNIHAIALDLGAGEVLNDPFADEANADATAIALKGLLARKSRKDQKRADTQRQLELSIRDPLTGLYNRRYAIPRLHEIASQAADKDVGFAVLAIDLDYFKSVNDQLGHAAGDAVLAEVARRLGQIEVGQGFVARTGGEEFLVVLPCIAELQACRIAERIRRAVDANPVEIAGARRVSISASIGVSHTQPGPDDLPCDIVGMAAERADRALLAAKKAGRNRVIASHPERAA